MRRLSTREVITILVAFPLSRFRDWTVALDHVVVFSDLADTPLSR